MLTAESGFYPAFGIKLKDFTISAKDGIGPSDAYGFFLSSSVVKRSTTGIITKLFIGPAADYATAVLAMPGQISFFHYSIVLV